MNQPLAYIHPNARIAEDVTIEAFAWIGEDVEIGSGTWIGPNATIMDGARIGKNCKIFPGAVISAIPQDLKYQGETTYCYIGTYPLLSTFCSNMTGMTSERISIHIELGTAP